jgi:hypothetical protein
VVRVGASILYNGALLGELIDLNPFGANFPTIGNGIVASPTLNANTPEQFSLNSRQITWTNAGPVFPAAIQFVSNGNTYSGTSCDYQSGIGGLPAWNQPATNTDGSAFTPTPCSLVAAVDPNYHTPWAAEWNLDVQRAITNNLTLEVAYVGNHGREGNKMDINEPPIGTGWTAAAINSCLGSKSTGYNACSPDTGAEAAGQTYASKFPYLQNVNQITNLAHSDYHGLQVTLTQRASHGLTFLLGYTFSHALDMLSGGSFDSGIAEDIRNVNLLYGNSDNDSRHRFTFSTVYNIPGRKAPLQMLQGWSISPIIAAFSGTPWTADDTTTGINGTGEINNSAFQGWNYNGPRSAFTSGPSSIPFFAGTSNPNCVAAAQSNYAGNAQLQGLAMASLTNLGCYAQGLGVLTPPAFGTIGNEGRNNFRGPAYYNVDLSIGKNWKFKERYSADFRAEFFNLFNRADYAQPSATDPSSAPFGCSCQTPDGTGFTNAVLGSGAPRSMQLGLKLTF